MPVHPRLLQSSALPRWSDRSLPLALLLAALAAAHLAGGVFCLWCECQSPHVADFRATTAAVLLVLSVIQLQLARNAWRQHVSWHVLHQRFCRRWLLSGLVGCYAASLWLDSPGGAPYVFWAALALWCTLGEAPLAAHANLARRLTRLRESRAFRLAACGTYLIVMAPLVTELGLRTHALLFDDPISTAFATQQLRLTPGATLAGGHVNAQGYWDQEFSPDPQPGVFRVAAVGDDLTLCGDAETNFLNQVERLAPGLEVYNFGLPAAGPREYAAQMARDVAAYRPDLVLLFVAVGSDIAQQTPPPTVFNSQWLHTVQLGSLCFAAPVKAWAGAGELCQQLGDQQAYLQHCTEQLAVCRTPLDERAHRQWREVFHYLDEVLARCRKHAIPAAIVIAPSEFQVNAQLCEVLRRRAGYAAEQLDVELPQRRLAAYAHERDVATLDLLPHLRNCSQPPFRRNEHALSDAGHTVAAEVIGGWLRTQMGPSHVVAKAGR